MIVPNWVPPWPLRDWDAHKGSVGKLGIIGGSPGLTGAVVLAQAAALRTGAGLVTCAVPESVHAIVATQTIEAMTLPVPDDDGSLSERSLDVLNAFLDTVDAVVVGPGLGRDDHTRPVIDAVVAWERPAAFDADALWHLSQSTTLDLGGRIVTPHEGELKRLIEGCRRPWIGRTREAVADLAANLNATVVAKGAGTFVACPNGEITVNPSGNPGLASGGSGDVLAGMIGAFLARGDDARDAATRAVWLHGRAADFAAYGETAEETTGRPPAHPNVTGIGEESLIASDVIANLSRAIRELQTEHGS